MKLTKVVVNTKGQWLNLTNEEGIALAAKLGWRWDGHWFVDEYSRVHDWELFRSNPVLVAWVEADDFDNWNRGLETVYIWGASWYEIKVSDRPGYEGEYVQVYTETERFPYRLGRGDEYDEDEGEDEDEGTDSKASEASERAASAFVKAWDAAMRVK